MFSNNSVAITARSTHNSVTTALSVSINEGSLRTSAKSMRLTLSGACWDEERVKQIGVMRIQMDNLAVRLAVHYGSNAEFLQMFDHAILCLEAAKAGDMVTRIKEDCAFHLELSVISKNQYLIDFQRRNYLRIEFLQSWRGGYLDIY